MHNLRRPGSFGTFSRYSDEVQDKFASLRQKTALLAEISLKYVGLTCIW